MSNSRKPDDFDMNQAQFEARQRSRQNPMARFFNTLTKEIVPSDTSFLEGKENEDFLRPRMIVAAAGLFSVGLLALQMLNYLDLILVPAIFVVAAAFFAFFGFHFARLMLVAVAGASIIFTIVSFRQYHVAAAVAIIALSVVNIYFLMVYKKVELYFIFKEAKRKESP